MANPVLYVVIDLMGGWRSCLPVCVPSPLLAVPGATEGPCSCRTSSLVHCDWLAGPYRIPPKSSSRLREAAAGSVKHKLHFKVWHRESGKGELPLPEVLMDLTATCKNMTGCRLVLYVLRLSSIRSTILLDISKNSGWQSDHGGLRSVL